MTIHTQSQISKEVILILSPSKHARQGKLCRFASRGSLVAQLVKNLPAMQETWVRSLGWEDPWRRERLPTPVLWPGEFRGLYSHWVTKSQTRLSDLHFASMICWITFYAFASSQKSSPFYTLLIYLIWVIISLGAKEFGDFFFFFNKRRAWIFYSLSLFIFLLHQQSGWYKVRASRSHKLLI